MRRSFRSPLGFAFVAASFSWTVGAQTPARPGHGSLPDTIQKTLDNVGCHRPRANQDKTVTRGHFVRSSQDDWAALCLSGQSSFIYVVWGGTAQCPSILASQRYEIYETSDGAFHRVLG